ncbi:alpha/beta fold hydrolase [Halobellus sp. EA9]|uniref:alpha/beta fold hydrolase n=1 Tax=Halobellus sp. EA9 TaxID=3421647 RepID=UPI003EBFE733
MSETDGGITRGRGTDSREVAPEALPPSATFERVETNGIELHALVAGDDDAPPVFLFHGFPEFWYGWRAQIEPLVDAGYRVIAPDQRGYNRSDKPGAIAAYAIDELAADAVGLLDAFGYDRARVVGHDWGAAVVWQTLLRYPERVDRAVTMNVPHPAVFQAFLPGRPSQLLKSWYIFFFQLPRVPEWTWRVGDWWGLRWFVDTSTSPETFGERALDRYKRAWSRPGAFTGMVNWYRALVREDAPEPPTWTVEPETMLIWGLEDPYLHPEMAEDSAERCANGRFEPIADATHWVQHEADERVNDLLCDFLE